MSKNMKPRDESMIRRDKVYIVCKWKFCSKRYRVSRAQKAKLTREQINAWLCPKCRPLKVDFGYGQRVVFLMGPTSPVVTNSESSLSEIEEKDSDAENTAPPARREPET